MMLSDQHRKVLEQASGISQEVIEARGYKTITTKVELAERGFGRSQQIVPTLLIPIYSPSGDVALVHHRPDNPRMSPKGGTSRIVKYEFPVGTRMAMDVHPFIREKVRDPSVPLFITEGVKKADSAISHGLSCISLIGTWNWRGNNEFNGKTALPDWESIALKNRDDKPRRVILAFDSDVMTKREVHAALGRLGSFLTHRGAKVGYVYLPFQEDGNKTGLDDYFAGGGTVDDLMRYVEDELRPLPHSESSAESAFPYEATESGTYYLKPDGARLLVANFTALILTQVTEDDGAETTRALEMEARRAGRTYQFTVAADRFSAMNWHIVELGSAAVIMPGHNNAAYLKTAIQLLSGEPPERIVFKQTGWREVEPDRWAYLHAGGAIGADSDRITVNLTAALARYQLPAPPDGNARSEAVRASLRVLNLGNDRVTFPLYSSLWSACLRSADFALHYAGASGAFKTELAALGIQHFGPEMDSRHLPASWESTENALEGLAFAANCAPLVIDDLAPRGGSVEVQRLYSKADRVIRGQGNASSRGRLNADLTLRVPRPPRGMVISTGEDIPPGQSLRARTYIVEMEKGDIDARRLSECQIDARSGLFAQAMAAYLAEIAPNYLHYRDSFDAEVLAWRGNLSGSGMHARTPGIMAFLLIGLKRFLAFAVRVEAISQEEEAAYWRRGVKAIIAVGAAQDRLQASSEPTQRYLELLQAAVSSGDAHIADLDGEQPEDPTAWGWRSRTVGVEHPRTEWEPQGKRIGWVDGNDLYLQPDAAYDMANHMARNGGERVTITSKVLNTRLKAQGLLVTTDEARQCHHIRKTIAGKRLSVLHLHRKSLTADRTAQTAQTASFETDYEARGQVAGQTPGQVLQGVEPTNCPKTGAAAAQSEREESSNGHNGQSGQFSRRHDPDDRAVALVPAGAAVERF